jgi:hypothetical protein
MCLTLKPEVLTSRQKYTQKFRKGKLMNMNPEERLKALITWGKAIGALTEELESSADTASPAGLMLIQARNQNPWFTRENVLEALKAIVFQLQEQNLRQWVSAYTLPDNAPRTIGVIMAGNLPAVGFQDVLCVLMSGNTLMMKCAADDKVILPFMLEILVSIEPRFRDRIIQVERLQNMDAVIATGSNNSARYFDYYFSKYPHIIRRNRNSVAVITGNETETELFQLGNAIFRYFGMGCRSVSHLLVPAGYDFGKLFVVLQQFGEVINHSRYMNNYDYHNALYLLNSEKFLTNNFLILRESPILNTPVSVLHYSYYSNAAEADAFLDAHKEEIQCVVGAGGIPFSAAQCPAPWEYADNVDVLDFLLKLK